MSWGTGSKGEAVGEEAGEGAGQGPVLQNPVDTGTDFLSCSEDGGKTLDGTKYREGTINFTL